MIFLHSHNIMHGGGGGGGRGIMYFLDGADLDAQTWIQIYSNLDPYIFKPGSIYAQPWI